MVDLLQLSVLILWITITTVFIVECSNMAKIDLLHYIIEQRSKSGVEEMFGAAAVTEGTLNGYEL